MTSLLDPFRTSPPTDVLTEAVERRNREAHRQQPLAQARHRIEFVYRPGKWMTDDQLLAFVRGMRRVASECFEDVPLYQALHGSRDELRDTVIAVARRPDGEMAGFCSAVVLPVPEVGRVLHLGLTCVRPADRSGGLTHKLTSALVLRYLLRAKPLGRQWFTNLACVLSSLGNVALNFEDVYPSPFSARHPTAAHLSIADAIDRYYRGRMYIGAEAVFDRDAFVFRGSVKGTMFQKSGDDVRYHHRDPSLNGFYRDLMNFEAGDEVLQVGAASLLTLPAYHLRQRSRMAAAVRHTRLIASA